MPRITLSKSNKRKLDMKKRNPIAMAVTRIVPKVVQSKKAYTRKVKHKKQDY